MLGSWSETDLEVGDRVEHVREPDALGTVTCVEDNRLSVMVRWDDADADDFQWANRVRRSVAPNGGA